jgi:hypothetical protein
MGDWCGWFRRQNIEITDAGGEAVVDFRQPDWRGNARSIGQGWLMGDPGVLAWAWHRDPSTAVLSGLSPARLRSRNGANDCSEDRSCRCAKSYAYREGGRKILVRYCDVDNYA